MEIRLEWEQTDIVLKRKLSYLHSSNVFESVGDNALP